MILGHTVLYWILGTRLGSYRSSICTPHTTRALKSCPWFIPCRSRAPATMFMFMISMLSTASPTKSQCYTFAVITLVCMFENTSGCYCLVLIGFSLSLNAGRLEPLLRWAATNSRWGKRGSSFPLTESIKWIKVDVYYSRGMPASCMILDFYWNRIWLLRLGSVT